MALDIKEIQKSDHLEELRNNSSHFEHVLVYDNGGIKHAVHVDKISISNIVICENSFGPENPDVRIALDDVLIYTGFTALQKRSYCLKESQQQQK